MKIAHWFKDEREIAFLPHAVDEDEVRIVEVGDETSVALRVCRSSRDVRRVLPESALAPAQSKQ